MKARTAVRFVDTNIIPDRNAGMGSLLWDLQHPEDADPDGPPLLSSRFAFIDVGVSRARAAIALKTLLTEDLEMDVAYVATERPEAVPDAHVTPMGDRAEKIRARLSAMISSREATREVDDWHCVVDREGRVSSVAYSYGLRGAEIWESYFMGRPFTYAGERVEFADPELDALLAFDVPQVEARIDRHPLEAGLAASGIALQKTAVPRRVEDRQNVLFLGNVLNNYPQDDRARELEKVAANLQEGDLVIVQADDVETSSIEVLRIRGQGAHTTRERVRWVDTRKLEVQTAVRGAESWRQVCLKPELDRMVSRLVDCLGRRVSSPGWSQEERGLARQYIGQVFRTFFRAAPVERTFRIAVREALRRLPSERGPNGMPVFEGDARDAYGGPLGPDPSPVVSDADLRNLGLGRTRGGDAASTAVWARPEAIERADRPIR